MFVSLQKKVEGVTEEEVSAIVAEITASVTALAVIDGHGWVYDPADLAAGKFARLSHYGEMIAVTKTGRSVTVSYLTCGGHKHSVEIDLASGYIVATSEGARSSHGWSMADHSETLAAILSAEKGSGWMLLECHTSQPEWGIDHWLGGMLKDGPACMQEAEQEAA